jgi:putative transposase
MARANRHHLPGYVWHEIQNPKQRYSLVNRQKLTDLLGIKDNDLLSEYHLNWVEEVLKNGSNQRDAKWTESIAACPVKPGLFI